jgi:hypothetical protein
MLRSVPAGLSRSMMASRPVPVQAGAMGAAVATSAAPAPPVRDPRFAADTVLVISGPDVEGGRREVKSTPRP